MTSLAKVQTKVVIRFSYLATSGFATSVDGVDAVERMLYDPTRMERRFRLFETLTLPSLKAQTCHDFLTCILIGEGFPSIYAERLMALVEDCPNIVIGAVPPQPNYQAVTRAFALLPIEKDVTHVASVRLDDVDALHVDSLRCISELAHGLLALRDPQAPFVIGFNRGYFLRLGSEAPKLSEVRIRDPLGIGLAMVAPIQERTNIYRRNHRKVSQFNDCYTEVAQPMFLRSVHQDNDSSAYVGGTEIELDLTDHAARLRADFCCRAGPADRVGMTP